LILEVTEKLFAMTNQEKISEALKIIEEEENGSYGWTELDENMSYLSWLSDEELVNEFLVLKETEDFGGIVLESALIVAGGLKKSEPMPPNHRYLLEYVLASIFLIRSPKTKEK
jgi:hypothetical protein